MLRLLSSPRRHRQTILFSACILLLCVFELGQCIKVAHPEEYTGLDDDDYALDIAIKLKKDFSDDPISDLFALTYGLEKIARLSELDREKNLFHFKLPKNHHHFTEDDDGEGQTTDRHTRFKRSLENRIDLLKQDDRVEYVLPQKYLKREKRDVNSRLNGISEKDLLSLLDQLRDESNIDYDDDDLDDQLDDTILYDANYKPKQIKVKNIYQLADDSIEKRLEKLKDELAQDLEYDKRRKDDSLKLDPELLKKYEKFKMADLLKLPSEVNFNDEKFKQQWYLIDQGQFQIPLTHDLNVIQAWLNGYTGKNVTIVIIDDGIDYEHPDFDGKYRADLSYNFNDEVSKRYDPMPSTFDNQNNHGTRCAGAAAANANNSVCGVGVAFDAQVAGIKILDGPITDLLEARALTYKAKDVHIRSASWGPRDDGTHMEYPGLFVNLALEEGVKTGRNGKGTLYIWASGNGGENEDDCSCDGYVSHWNIISIGSVNHRGMKPYFMELCPSTMAVVYSGGQTSIQGDEDDPGVRVIASDVRGKCTSTFQGTSSAAPLAAGALALVLEANPNLGYRDVMHLIASTSRIPNVEDTDGWIINGAKYHVNEKYGFGVLDVSQMIEKAQTWKNVGPREKCIVDFKDDLPEIESGDKITLQLNVDGCENIDYLEHVVANISFSFTSRGDLKMILISPHGTPSEILSFRKNDRSNKGVDYFPFMTLFNWGESPRGTWKLVIEARNTIENQPNSGRLRHFSLTLFGTKKVDDNEKGQTKSEGDIVDDEGNSQDDARLNKRYSNLNSKAFMASDEDVRIMYKRELDLSRQTKIIHKRFFEKQVKT